MSLNLYEVGLSDCNGEDFTYTVAAAGHTEAAALAVKAHLSDQFDDVDDLRDDTDDLVKVTEIASAETLSRRGVVPPQGHVRLSLAVILDELAVRNEETEPTP